MTSKKSTTYGLLSVALGLVLGFTCANWKATTVSAGTTTPWPALAPQGDGQDKPVEQTKKNIQVLKGLPTSQLFPLMNFIGASLGVKCAYCHVSAGKDPQTGRTNWVWESDDKETKRTARRMMQMVLAVNKSNRADFRGEPVTCYTCHRGQTEVARFPQLPLAASAHEDGGTAVTGKSAESLPGVEQVLNKYIAAVGGRAAAAKLQTRVLKGTLEQTQGRNPAVEITFKEPNKYLLVLTTKQQGIISQGFNGTTGWIKTAETQREMTADEVAQVKGASALYDVIKVKEPYTGMTVTGKEKVGEREAYVVETKSGDAGGRIEKLFFDTETGLLLRRLVLTNALLFPIPEQTDFEDYRDVDGVKLPFTIRTSNIDTFFSSTRKFTEIKSNVTVDDTRFNPPPPPSASPPKP